MLIGVHPIAMSPSEKERVSYDYPMVLSETKTENHLLKLLFSQQTACEELTQKSELDVVTKKLKAKKRTKSSLRD